MIFSAVYLSTVLSIVLFDSNLGIKHPDITFLTVLIIFVHAALFCGSDRSFQFSYLQIGAVGIWSLSSSSMSFSQSKRVKLPLLHRI